MQVFLEELREQRGTIIATTITAASTSRCIWSVRSQFLVAYVLVFTDPAIAALIGWLVAMRAGKPVTSSSSPRATTRSTRRPTSTRKRSRSATTCNRKIVLLAIWALSPLLLWFDPTLFGMFAPHRTAGEFVRHVGPDLAGPRRRRAAVPHCAPVLHQGRADGSRVDDQDPHRPVPRHQALLQSAAVPAAR